MLNKAQIIGRLGQTPEIRTMPNGDAVCNFSVATTEKWKDKSGEVKEETEWHRVSAWGKTAEIIGKYLSKGSLIYIEGKMKSRKYTDKDGIEKTSYEIRATDMKMLGSKNDSQQIQTPAEQNTQPTNQRTPDKYGFQDLDDDIPF